MSRLGSRLLALVGLAGAAAATGAGLGAALTTAGAGALLFSTTSATSATSVSSATTVGPAVSTTTATAAVTTTTTVPHGRTPPPVAATLDPCQAPAAGAPCAVEPTQIEITGTAPMAIQVQWLSEKGRPTTAPSPAETSVMVTKSTACRKSVSCWAWPPQLTASNSSGSWILNGTYQVTACTLPTGNCTPVSTSSPASLAVAAPAAGPASVKTSYSTADGVTVSWKATAVEPPDVVGYEISRQGEIIYACRTGTSTTPLSAAACNSSPSSPSSSSSASSPSSLTFRDQPNAGNWIYSVATLRYGVDATTGALVASQSKSSIVQVTQDPATGNTLPPYVPAGLPAVPDNAANGYIQAVPPVYTIPPPTTAVTPETTAAPVESGPAQSLPFSSPGEQSAFDAAAAETGPKNTNLDSWAAVAVGLLALALALHVWFLRGQLGTYSAQHRKAAPSVGPRPR